MVRAHVVHHLLVFTALSFLAGRRYIMLARKSGSGPRLEIVIDEKSHVGREMVDRLRKGLIYVHVK